MHQLIIAFFVRKAVCGRLLSISVSPDTQGLVDNFGWKVLIHGTNNYFKYFKYIFNKVAFFDFSIEFENHANMQKYSYFTCVFNFIFPCSWGIVIPCSWGIVSIAIAVSKNGFGAVVFDRAFSLS